VAALDGATGTTLRVYEETRDACEILCTGDVLVCAVNPKINLPPKKGWADGYAETRLPGRSEIVAVRTSGQLLWRHEVSDRLWGQSLCAACGKTVYVAGNEVVCLNDRTGAVEWRHRLPEVETDKSLYHVRLVGRPTVIIHKNAVLVARGGKEVTAIDPRSGEKRWSAPCGSGFRFPPDMFVIGDDVWVGESIAWQKEPDLQRARDILTGQVTARIDTSDAFIAAHHHRCYRNKATERFFLTGRRGVAFIDPAADTVQKHYWVRGTCNYGVLPCNGLLYVPPDACSCYGQVRLRGFSALSPRRSVPAPRPRGALQKGPAYALPAGAESATEDWPTYRHDPARSGVARTAVPAELGVLWDVQLTAPLTPPVAVAGRVFVAAKDSHTLHAVDSDTGHSCWQYTVGARIDSPPTFWRERVLFGSADGFVYCLDASEGQLCWRRRVAPLDRSIMVREQLESAWPVSGSLLVTADSVLGVAGRSSYLDGGLRLFRLDARSGQLLWQRTLYSRDSQSGAQPRTADHFHIDGFLPDILSMQDGLLFMRNRAFDLDGRPHPGKIDHLYSSLGFLDDTGFHRGYWLYGHTVGEGWGGWRMMKGSAAGALLTIDREAIYGYGRNKLVQPSGNVRLTFPMPGVRRALFKLSEKGSSQWTLPLPFEARALAVTESVLFAAGPMGDTWQSLEAYNGRNGAELWSVSAQDGSKLHRVEFDAMPVFDGLIAARGKLYLSTVDGHVVCLGVTPNPQSIIN
jgi:outer membrane protein assembly factor BamB